MDGPSDSALAVVAEVATAMPTKAKKTPTKSKATAQSTPRKRNRKTASAHVEISQEELHKEIRLAKEAYIPGIRIVPYMGLEGTPLMAGYLGLKDTNELRAFLKKVNALPIAVLWMESRKVSYGMEDTSTGKKYPIQSILTFAAKPKFITEETFSKGLPLSTDLYPTGKNSTRGFASWLVTMRALMVEFPDRFPGVSDGPDSLELSKIEPENWNRALARSGARWQHL